MASQPTQARHQLFPGEHDGRHERCMILARLLPTAESGMVSQNLIPASPRSTQMGFAGRLRGPCRVSANACEW